MKKSLAAALVAVAVVLGAGVGWAVGALEVGGRAGTPESGKTPVVTPTQDAGSLLAGPGHVGPVRAGMSIDDAIATGWIARDTERAKSCDLDPATNPYFKWVGDQSKIAGLDIQVTAEGKVASIGIGDTSTVVVEEALPSRLQIGSTYQMLREVYGDTLEQRLSDYGQVTFSVEQDGKWIGFLFDEDGDTLRDDSTVSFIEVTFGRQPSLLRDGC